MLSRPLSVNYSFQSSPVTVAVLNTHSHFLKQSQPSCLLCRGGEELLNALLRALVPFNGDLRDADPLQW